MEFGSTALNNLNYEVGDYTSGEYKNINLMELLSNIPTFEEKHDKIVKYFKNNKHTFKAIITKQDFGYTVKIGGRDYLDCINISLTVIDNIVTKAKISHIQSEPECAFGTYLEDGDMVNFLKATLQFCQYEFPTLKTIELDDMSNIDCGKSLSTKPPRKQERPFSLAHFYIARTGKTWYENRFGAIMKNDDIYSKYRTAVQILSQKIFISYTTFMNNAQFNNDHSIILEKYFSPEKTWIEFFNSIPKTVQCKALYNWLQSFINDIIDNSYTPYGWYIDIDEMDKTTFKIVEAPKNGGGSKKTRRKGRKTGLRFSNQWW